MGQGQSRTFSHRERLLVVAPTLSSRSRAAITSASGSKPVGSPGSTTPSARVCTHWMAQELAADRWMRLLPAGRAPGRQRADGGQRGQPHPYSGQVEPGKQMERKTRHSAAGFPGRSGAVRDRQTDGGEDGDQGAGEGREFMRNIEFIRATLARCSKNVGVRLLAGLNASTGPSDAGSRVKPAGSLAGGLFRGALSGRFVCSDLAYFPRWSTHRPPKVPMKRRPARRQGKAIVFPVAVCSTRYAPGVTA